MNYKKLLSKTKKLSILLVDDYKYIRNDLESIFEDIFQSVIVADNGQDALEIYQNYFDENQKYIDIILTDIEMPQMNGIELSEKILQINKDQDIIVISAYTDSKYLIKLINLGVSQFITKPIEIDMLLNSILDISTKIELKNSNIANEKSSILKLDNEYTWDNDKLILAKNGSEIILTRHELILMLLLSKRVNSISTNEMIIDHFYDYGIHISEDNVRKLIFKFRKKIPKKMIETIYGIGYKLIVSI
ncbi:two component transcriptional regulator, winged helix family [hydrothermal vent metagenome]|uniref:Two component transcriptional regulator, winged helix family n=1 Tax=hydrothermal vent metagenome TaxID=652676 RepID=A0A1W1BWR1_9ZZZZ